MTLDERKAEIAKMEDELVGLVHRTYEVYDDYRAACRARRDFSFALHRRVVLYRRKKREAETRRRREERNARRAGPSMFDVTQ